MPRAWSREQSQVGEAGEWAKPGLPWERWPGCGGQPVGVGSACGVGACPSGRGYMSQVGSLELSEGIQPCSSHSWDLFDAPQRLQEKFECGFLKLASEDPFLWALLMLASTHTHPGHARAPCPLLLQGGREGEETGEVLELRSKDWNSRLFLAVLTKSGLPATEVYNKAMLAPGGTLRGRGLRLAL